MENNIFDIKLPKYIDYCDNKDGIKDIIVDRWDKMGLTAGLEGNIKDKVSYAFEDAAHKFIDDDEKTLKVSKYIEELWKTMSYEMDCFPILRRVNANSDYKEDTPYLIDSLSDFIINNIDYIGKTVTDDLLNKGFDTKEKVEKLDMEAIYCAYIEQLIINKK